MKEDSNTKEKGGLFLAIDEALKKGTEQDRMIAILNCVKGYKSQYDIVSEKAQFDGFSKCKNEYKGQIKKIQDYISNHNF